MELSESLLWDISHDLGDKWEAVGYKLGMEESDIQRAKANNQLDMTKQAQALLIQWRKKTPTEQNKSELLARALKNADCIEVAEKYGLQEKEQTSCSASYQSSVRSSQNATDIPPKVLQVFLDLKTVYGGSLSRVTPFSWMEKGAQSDLKKHFHSLHLVRHDPNRDIPFLQSNSSPFESPPIAMSNIFNSHEDCETPRRILIEGEPGIGKTSLCTKLAVDWSQGEAYIADKFQGVFLINARNIKGKNLETYISERFYTSLSNPVDKDQHWKYMKENQDKLLFIIDGLDEVVDSLPDDWIDLISGDLGCQFIRSCVLVTSRSNQWQSKVISSSDSSHKAMDRCFGIKLVNFGFTQEIAFKFIDSLSQAESLKKFIRENDFLLDLIRSPLMCMFLCFMWRQGFSFSKERQEFRRTGLYVSMIMCILKRFCGKNDEKRYHLANGKDIPRVILNKLDMICKLAYKSLLEGKSYISLTDVKKYLNDLSIVESDVMFRLGILLKELKFDFTDCEEETVFVFPHRTVQEELAAEYYIKMPEEEIANATQQVVRMNPQMAIFICGLLCHRKVTTEHLVPFFTGLGNTSDFSGRLCYYFALECVYESKFQQKLTNIIANHLQGRVAVVLDSQAILFALLACLENSKSNPTNLLISWASNDYFCIDVSYLSSIIKNNSMEFLELNKFRITQSNQNNNQGYEVLSKTLETNKSLMQLKFNDCKISNEGWKALGKSLKSNSGLTHLNLNNCEINEVGCRTIFRALKVNKSLKKLSIGYLINQEVRRVATLNSQMISVSINYPLNSKLNSSCCETLAETLETNRILDTLDLSGCMFTKKGWEDLTVALKTNTTLTGLGLPHCQIASRGCKELAIALKSHTSLTSLDLSFCKIDDRGWKELAAALKSNNTLNRLYLNGIEITEKGWKPVTEALKTNTELKELHLANSKISVVGITTLAEALEVNTGITHLNLQQCAIPEKALAKTLKANNVLQQLDLCYCNITNNGWKNLAGALKSLTCLSLQGCTILDKGWEYIAIALKSNYKLKQLNLAQCKINLGGYNHLASVLRTNLVLTHLNLKHCLIPEGGLVALAKALEKSNNCLECLNLSRCRISDAGWEALSDALKAYTALAQLHLKGCMIPNEEWNNIAEALETNTSLTKLDLSLCVISNSGWIALSQALKTNTSLTHLNLNGCVIPDEGCETLALVLETNTTLSELDLNQGKISSQGWKTLQTSTVTLTKLKLIGLLNF